jgi:mono/diheme cytochrome c family protein
MRALSASVPLLLAALLLGRCGSPSPAGGPSAEGAPPAADSVPGFFPEIATLIYENCTPCHRAGGAGPFPLAGYADVAKRTRMIKLVTGQRIMPPWPADPDYRHFLYEKRLSDAQIARIAAWVDAGAPIGDTTRKVWPGWFPEGSQLGEPDLVLRFPPQRIPGNAEDRFLLMKVPYRLPADTFVRAIEFIPGNRRLVHHMNANLIGYEAGAKDDVFGGERVIPTDWSGDARAVHERFDHLNDDGSWPELTRMVCNYLPGVQHAAYPEGIGGFRLPASGSFFINDLHYGPSAEPATDESRFNLFFARKAPRRETKEFMMGTFGEAGGPVEPPLILPPDTVMAFRVSYRIPRAISLLTVNPHMHLLGKSFTAYALPPHGDTIPLVRIPRWNFRWQYFYTFPTLLPLPAGTEIVVEAEMDNTADNPDQAFDPPRPVREPPEGSMRTTDEMLQFIVTYTDYRPGDDTVSLHVPWLGLDKVPVRHTPYDGPAALP